MAIAMLLRLKDSPKRGRSNPFFGTKVKQFFQKKQGSDASQRISRAFPEYTFLSIGIGPCAALNRGSEEIRLARMNLSITESIYIGESFVYFTAVLVQANEPAPASGCFPVPYGSLNVMGS